MAPLEMTELMRQHRFDLASVQFLQQGVEKDDALVAAEAGEIGVAMAGTPRAVHHENPLCFKAGALQKFADARRQGVVAQRFEFVEQRRDDDRVGPQHQQTEAHPGQPDVDPPGAAGMSHQPQYQCRERRAQYGHDRRLLDQIGGIGGRSGAIESEALFDYKGAVD